MMKKVTPELKIEALNQMIYQGRINQLLYKYRMNNENTERIFSNQTLWFAHPNEFDDPYDCWANVQSLDQEGLNDMIEQASCSGFEKKIYLLGAKAYTADMLKKDIDEVMHRIGVGCFCKTEKSFQMWSEYSDNHKGICLQFDVLEDPDLFTFAHPVNYVAEIPEYNHFKDYAEILEKVILTKTNKWEHEREVRVVKTSQDIEKNGGSQAFPYKPSALKKVIFGCNAEQKTIDKYINLCMKNSLNKVEFTQMQINEDGLLEEKVL